MCDSVSSCCPDARRRHLGGEQELCRGGGTSVRCGDGGVFPHDLDGTTSSMGVRGTEIILVWGDRDTTSHYKLMIKLEILAIDLRCRKEAISRTCAFDDDAVLTRSENVNAPSRLRDEVEGKAPLLVVLPCIVGGDHPLTSELSPARDNTMMQSSSPLGPQPNLTSVTTIRTFFSSLSGGYSVTSATSGFVPTMYLCTFTPQARRL